MGWLPPDRRYQTLNLLGGGAFVVNGAYHGAWPTVVSNAAWFVISVVALIRAPVRKEMPLRERLKGEGDSTRDTPSGEQTSRTLP